MPHLIHAHGPHAFRSLSAANGGSLPAFVVRRGALTRPEHIEVKDPAFYPDCAVKAGILKYDTTMKGVYE